MRIWLALPSAIAALLLGTPHTNWVPFYSRDGRFVVTAPDMPQELVKSIHTTHGPIEMHEFIVRPGGGADEYFIAYQTLSPEAAHRPADFTLNGAIKGAARGMKGRVMSCRRCAQQGFPGCEFTVANVQGALHISHVFIANSRLYQVNVWAPGSKTIPADAAKFIGSFKLTTRR